MKNKMELCSAFSDLTYCESMKIEGGFPINPALGPLITVVPPLYPQLITGVNAAIIGAKIALGQ